MHLICEEKLMEICDLKFLFVEPGVFGELRSKPAIPPAPRSHTVFESATDIIRRDKKTTTGQQVAPLNLSVVPPDLSTNIAIGDNKTETARPTLTEPIRSDASTANVLDQDTHPPVADTTDTIVSATNMSDQGRRPSVAEVSKTSSGPEHRSKNSASEGEDTSIESKHSVPNMPVCTVPLRKLKNTELVKWLGETSSINITDPSIGYQLQVHKNKHVTRLDRRAKQDIKYTFYSDESSDSDSATGHNTNCTKRRKPNVYPLKGPSADRLKAHKLMLLRQKEQSAAEALLELGDGTPSHSSDEGAESSVCSEKSSSTRDVNSSSSDSNSGSMSSSSSWSTSGCSSRSSGYESDSVKVASDSSSDSNNSDKKEPQSETSDPEDDLPLSQLKVSTK